MNHGPYVCPHCSYPNPVNYVHCERCGQALAAQPVAAWIACPHCRTINPPGNQFCAQCGQALSAPPITQPRRIPTWVILPAGGLLLVCLVALLGLYAIYSSRHVSASSQEVIPSPENPQDITPQQAAEIGVRVLAQERPDMAGVTPQVTEKETLGHKIYDVTFVGETVRDDVRFKQVVIVSIDTTQSKIFISESN